MAREAGGASHFGTNHVVLRAAAPVVQLQRVWSLSLSHDERLSPRTRQQRARPDDFAPNCAREVGG